MLSPRSRDGVSDGLVSTPLWQTWHPWMCEYQQVQLAHLCYFFGVTAMMIHSGHTADHRTYGIPKTGDF